MKIKCSEPNDDFNFRLKKNDIKLDAFSYPDYNHATKAIPESTSLLSVIDFKKPNTLSVEVRASNGSLNNINSNTIKNNNRTLLVNANNNNNSILSVSRVQETQLSDLEVISILNKFVFSLFVIFILLLNLFSLYLLPFFVRIPLTIDD